MVTHRVGICIECAFMWESALVQGELHLRLILAFEAAFASYLELPPLLEGLALFLRKPSLLTSRMGSARRPPPTLMIMAHGSARRPNTSPRRECGPRVDA